MVKCPSHPRGPPTVALLLAYIGKHNSVVEAIHVHAGIWRKPLANSVALFQGQLMVEIIGWAMAHLVHSAELVLFL